MPRIDLLHALGDAPEGPWSVFSSPNGDGSDMVSVVVPKSLWQLVTKANPFSSEISLLEQLGQHAIERHLAKGVEGLLDPIYVSREDVGDLIPEASVPWYRALRICSVCHQEVPAGEVSEGLSNALPPDSRGEIQLKVLCPPCQVQTDHRLTPWGIPQ